MSDLYSVVKIDPSDADKISQHLDTIKESQASNSELSVIVNSATQEFNKFFLGYGRPYFTPNKFLTSDTPRSELYNEMLKTLNQDLNKAYTNLGSASNTALAAFNYSTVVNKEIVNSASISASKVLDLNLLNGFTKGAVLVAGDDFSNANKIDKESTGLSRAEAIQDGGALSLSRVDSKSIVSPTTTISISPIKPAGPDGKVTTDATPDNLERFYEGKYYSFIGQQNPEGGRLDIKYVVNPKDIPQLGTTVVSGNNAIDDVTNKGFFAIVPSSEEAKRTKRALMFDGDPDTYWECEFVYRTEPLVDISDTVDASQNANATITIDAKTAEDLARKFDYSGRDLQVNLDIDFGTVVPINFILINPVVSGTSSFIKVTDIATSATNADFETVDGFANQAFDKILTPEANKVLPDDIQAKSFAPSAFSYSGIGVFTFPVRFAQKVRITLLVEDPTPAIYERLCLLFQEITNTEVSKKKKGLFSSSTKKTNTKEVTNSIVKLTYLETLAFSQNLFDPKSLETQEVVNASTIKKSNLSLTDAIRTTVVNPIGTIASLFGFGKTTTKVKFNSTGAKLKDQWLEPQYDRIRYSIGIRELVVAQYIFAESSEIISIPYLSPKEIIKINVYVDEYIPTAYDNHTQWIKYYIKPEGDTEWIQINPMNTPTKFNDAGDIIPRIVNFNIPKPTSVASESKYNYTASPVKKIRFRAVLSRPSGADNSSTTPLLKSYRIIMSPRD